MKNSIGQVKFLAVSRISHDVTGHILTIAMNAKPVLNKDMSKCSISDHLYMMLEPDFRESENLALQAISNLLVDEGYEFGLLAERSYIISFPDYFGKLRGKSAGLAFAIAQLLGWYIKAKLKAWATMHI